VILFLLAAASAAQTPHAETSRFQACAALVRADPEQALSQANEWRVRSGGLAARQCLGLAYAALERWPSAATVFEQAAREAAQSADPRVAELWAQSGNAWLAAEQPEQALHAFDAALAVPGLAGAARGAVHLDRARAMVDLGDDQGARTDIDRALTLAPSDSFALYLSAALARRTGSLDRAAADISRALELAPAEPEFLLLAGTIAGLGGDIAAARDFYELAAAGPDSPAAAAARAALRNGENAPVAEPQPR
jgi:tetratricopeptide (TPR) repeat protein